MSPAEANAILRPLIEASSPEIRAGAARVGVYAAAAADALGLSAEQILMARALAELQTLSDATLSPAALALRAAASAEEEVRQVVALAQEYDKRAISAGRDSAESWLSLQAPSEFGAKRAAALHTCAGLIQPQNS